VELIRRLDRLYAAVVSDCLDEIGIRNNAMDTRIRPIAADQRLAGYASTVTPVQVDRAPEDPADYYAGELQAVNGLQPGDVMVTAQCDGAYWGELLATAAVKRGAVGIVCDAYTRDTRALIAMPFPTFVAGISPQDSLGRVDVAAVGESVECGGVTVKTGDLVIADLDGVVVIPEEVAAQVIERAERKVSREDEMRRSLRSGMPVTTAFDRYGVL